MADPSLLLLHGFTQTGASWEPVRRLLPPEREVHAPDLPGHGSAAEVYADLAETARLLAAPLEEPAVVVGYSMGGRIALRLVLDHPHVVAGLVLVGATAGIDDPDERAERARADQALAAELEAHGTDAFLETWLAQPLFANLVLEPADRAARAANSPQGLAASLRLAGTGTMDPPWWDALSAIACPVLVVWGEHDRKFAAIGRRLVETIGSEATAAEVPGVGHAAHLEAPQVVAELVEAFAEGVRGAPPSQR